MENPVLEYKDIKYINVYTDIDYELELKLIDMVSKSNFVDDINVDAYLHKVVIILVDGPTRGFPIDVLIDKVIIESEIHDNDPVQIHNLVQSFRSIGIVNPIIIDENYKLIAGNHRLAAAKECGWQTIRAVIINEDEVSKYLSADDKTILSVSYVDKRYLGYNKLYYFYSTIGNLSDDAEIQLYEITRKSLIEYEKNYASGNYGNFLGIILNKKKDVLISHLNLKSCDTPYQEGTVWYDNFDGTDLII
jgi:hypothetical protein